MAEQAHTIATSEVPGDAPPEHVEATAFGLNAGGWVALAMLVVIAILLWQKVPSTIAKALDKKIALIREQLAEAEALRKEAEALKAEYEGKAKAADKEAKAMIERAKHEAEAMLVKAQADADALVERRGRIAEDKIAAEERAAIDQLRATAANAARQAAAKLIVERLDDKSDKALVDQAIGGLAR